MKSKINHIEMKRLRWDLAFGRLVRIFGLFILAIFATLILHIIYNAIPLFLSPSIQMVSSAQNEKAEHSIGTIDINGRWLNVSHHKCSISVSYVHEQSTNIVANNNILLKTFAPDCDKKVLGLMGPNNDMLATVNTAGLLEVHKILTHDTMALQLVGSFMLPDAFKRSGDSAKWSVFSDNGEVFVALKQDKQVWAVWHPLSRLSAPLVHNFEGREQLLPLFKREQLLVIKDQSIHVQNRQGEILQRIDIGTNILHAQILPNQLDIILVTQDHVLHKHTLFNANGVFMLHPVFTHPLPKPHPLPKLHLDASAVDDNNLPQRHTAGFFIHSDPQHKALFVADYSGNISIVNSVTGVLEHVYDAKQQFEKMQYSRGQILLTHSGGYSHLKVNNLVGMISIALLFSENTYSGYGEAQYIWQSSMASEKQSAKYSVVPLIMGSLKASLLALIVALPLSLGAAIYTAYFAKPSVRNTIKPIVEMLEAVPSVIIGFIAAVWLAPFAEQYLLSIFIVVILLPFVVVLMAMMHSALQPYLVHTKFENWQLAMHAILLVGAVVSIFLLSLLLSDNSLVQNEGAFFGMGDDFTLSKTAIVVALALGIAIAPTIYTLMDDALYEVPDGVKQAAFALGATPIQTLFKVVLVVALPSIVSAIMLGFGRAFGETMIVLMVTGNTPIANWDLLSGLRTLTSNLAIELQEAQIDSSLFHILFLTAAILFVFTFVINTIAALIKRRMYHG